MPKARVIISLDTREPQNTKKTKASFPLVLRISHNGTTRSVALGYSIPKDCWDNQKREIKGKYKGVSSVSRLNNLLAKKRSDAQDIITALDESKKLQSTSIQELKDLVAHKKQNTDFFAFTESLIHDMREKNQIGNARAYDFVLKVLKKFVQKRELPFYEVNYDFLMKLEKMHLAKGNAKNGLAVYMRTIRAICNKAIKARLVDKQHYPFEDYKIKTEPTQKRAITEDEMKAILNLDVSGKKALSLAQDLFACSYYLIGANFKDLCLLKKENVIRGERIVFFRAKTKFPFNIKMNERVASTIQRYIKAQKEQIYIFPIIKRTTALDIAKDIEWARKRHNNNLKVLAKMAGVETNLTSYVARHTMATQARTKIPISVLQELMGHQSVTTTEQYIASLPNETKDDYARLIFEDTK